MDLLFSAALFAATSLAPAGWCADFVVTGYGRYALDPVFRDGSPVWTPGPVVAVDPRIIPLGSWVWIEGVGTHKARDTGGGVLGLHLDIAFDTVWEARQWGRQLRYACVEVPR